jgi:hypothetical protein
MTGSSLVPIIVPIMAFFAGAIWLGLVYWADAHPEWKAHTRAAGHEATGAGPEPKAAITAGPGGSRPAPAHKDKAAA